MKKSIKQMRFPQQDESDKKHWHLKLLVASTLLCVPTLSFAYIGPGAGLTMLGALWAVVLAVVFIVGGLLLWPIRILLRRSKGAPQTASTLDGAAKTPVPAQQDSGDS